MQQTVFVIGGDDAARASLTFLMRTQGLTSRAFASARAFLDQLHKDERGCVITDLRMPGMDGFALVRALGEIGYVGPVIMITGYATVPLAVRAMKAGVADFIEKPFESETILTAVRLALAAADKREAAETERAVVGRRRKSLTGRENQVLSLLVDGLSNKQIGHRLEISFRTVEIHRAKVMAKMQADSLSALVRMTATPAPATIDIDTPYPQQHRAALTSQVEPTSLKVLLAEDDDADAYLITEALTKLDRTVEVVRARDGVEAMRLIDSGVVTPHLAIVDLHMPRMNGFSLLLELARGGHDPFPCAVVTSSIASVDHIRAEMRGAFHVLTKPESIHEMETALSAIVATI